MNPGGFPVPEEGGARPGGTPDGARLSVTADTGFTGWLAEHDLSLALSTYQTCRLLLVGRRPDGRPAVFERLFERAMGLYADPARHSLWLSCQTQLWRLANVLAPGEHFEDGDALFVPRASFVTGDLDIHELVVDGAGVPWFVATGINSLATVDERFNVRPVWRPSCVSALVAEDRCHLNGLALRDGRPRYVSLVAGCDHADGWRERRLGGGLVLDLDDGSVVCSGLTMPHSPRWFDGALWLLDSGSGWLGRAEGGIFRPVAFCPGFARGLAFVNGHAVVGLSQPRRASFGDLPIEEELQRRDQAPLCGVLIIDLARGSIVHWLRFEGVISELFDVQILPGVARPLALGFRDDSIRSRIFLPPPFARAGG